MRKMMEKKKRMPIRMKKTKIDKTFEKFNIHILNLIQNSQTFSYKFILFWNPKIKEKIPNLYIFKISWNYEVKIMTNEARYQCKF